MMDFHPLIPSDIKEAVLFYEQSDPGIGLGDRFMKAANAALDRIEQNSKIGSYVFRARHIRKLRLEKFPFSIHYRIMAGDTLFVLGIYHSARHPDAWRERL
jgi:ParE toxin of type II toxin-antitoxin system, parDE